MKKLLRRNKKAADDKNSQTREEANLPVLHITDALLAETGNLLASFAEKKRSEGVVYWFGLELEEISVVTSLIVPDADTSWGCILTSPEANAEVLSLIVGTPLVLLGQVHSHPGNKVRHSDIDNRQTFASFEGAISVVIPYFGKKGINLRRCGIHRHIGGGFKVISHKQLEKHIVVIPGKADLRRNSEPITELENTEEK
jgi:proteasome lid subunit RPN8/RPN11